MKNIKKRIAAMGGCCAIALVILARCAETEVIPPKVESGQTAPPARKTTSSEDKSPATLATEKEDIKAADIFQRFLLKQLSTAEASDLLDQCVKQPDANPFCYSIVNFESLEANRKKSNVRTSHKSKRARIKIFDGQIENWDVLRQTSIGSLLRGLAAASPSEIRKVRERLASDTACPNPMAIAMAASLEDDLPERITARELATLYENGGKCKIDDPADQESALCRAGLFFFLAQDFENALKTFTRAAAVTGAYTGRSLYWLYRTKLALKDTAGAESALEKMRVKYPFSFHTLAALTSISADPGEILKTSVNVTGKRSTSSPATNNLIQQVEILHRLERNGPAAKVLSWAIAESQAAEPEVRLYLAELSDNPDDYRLQISLLSDVLYKHPALAAKETMERYFPKVFFPVFEKHASGLDPYFLMSVARQESAFNAHAVSRAKAKGLMQILSKTGRRFWNAKSMDLKNPNTNVEIGSRYLQELLRRTGNQVHLALAAYNAGESRLAAWETRYQTNEPILFIDLIPYRETREYVASILRNYFWYRRIHAPIEGDRRIFDLAVSKEN